MRARESVRNPSIRLSANVTSDAAKKYDKQDALYKTFREVAENDPKQTGSMVRCDAGEEGNETDDGDDYSPNTHDPNQGEIASYIGREDETL